MPASLDTAITGFRACAQNNLFTTWFIHANPREIMGAIARDGHSVLRDQILTLRKFAGMLVKKADTGKSVLDTDIQFIRFQELAAESAFQKGDYPLPLQLIKEIITVYTFTGYYNVTIGEETEKHRIIAGIIKEYKNWCEEHNFLDSVTVLKEAVKILREHRVRIDMLYLPERMQQNPLMQELYEALQEYPHERYQTENQDVHPAITCLQYHTEKSEISATIDRIAGLLESGVDPKEILVLSPDIRTTESAFREYAPDFYVTRNGLPEQFTYSCSSSGPALEEIPMVSPVLSVLAAVTANYGIRDMESVLATPYFPKRPSEQLTAGKLHLISDLGGGGDGKAFFLKLGGRIDRGFSRYTEEIKEIRKVIDWLQPLEKGGTTYEKIAGNLLGWLERSGWMQADADELNTKARGVFIGILRKLKESPVSQNACTVSRFTSLIQRLAAQTMVPHFHADSIRVVNLRDSSYDGADYVFLVNMTAESVPNVVLTLPPFTESETDALIPQLKEDMYRGEEEHMQTAMHAARKELIISYPERQKKNVYSPSGFLTRLGLLQTVNAPEVTHSVAKNQIRAGKELKGNGIVTGSAVGLTDGADVYRRAETVRNNVLSTYDFSGSAEYADGEYHGVTSPTTIEAYLTCPLKWFFSKHMGLYTPFDESNEGMKIGTAVHNTLEAFFKEFPAGVTEENLEDAREVLFRLAEEKIDAEKIQSPSWEAERQRYLGLNGFSSPLDAFLDWELVMEAQGWRTADDMVEHQFDRVLERDGRQITLKGIIDRILVRENEFIILDYKTGHSFAYTPETKVQIPLYAEAFREETGTNPVDGIYLKIDPKGKDMVIPISVTVKDKSVLPIQQVIDEAIQRSVDAINGMQKGKCSPTVKCTDRYCMFQSLCRRCATEEAEK